MRKATKKMVPLAALTSLLIFCFITQLKAKEAYPQPGETIDKSNYETYKHLFPEVFLEAFTTGWDLIEPLSITIQESAPNKLPQIFLDLSENNKGKYSLDSDGIITGGPYDEIVGLPFPDITPKDENFVTKFMWNFDYRYQLDDMTGIFLNYQKRKGSPTSTSIVESMQLNFQNRMYDDPKPLFESKNSMRNVTLLRNTYPPAQKNFMTLLIRYIDQKEQDATYLYLPTMRRVLRGEAGQRSTPINASTQAPDDFDGGFAGRIPDFNYELVGEDTLIVLGNAKLGYSEMKGKAFENMPVENDNWMLKDVYVIDITAKDKNYPQGKKRIWVDKENYWPYYAAAWDRAGALWKIWQTAMTVHPMASGDTVPRMKGMLGMDIQLGYGIQMFGDWKLNGNDLKESDVNVAAMRRKAR